MEENYFEKDVNEIMRGWKTGEKLLVASSQIQFKKRSRLLFPLSLRESSKREVFIWRASSISSYHIFHSFVARKVVRYLYSFSNSNSFTCFIVTFFCFSSEHCLVPLSYWDAATFHDAAHHMSECKNAF